MSSFKTFDIAGSGMSAQSVRLNTTASNLANAESVSGDPNKVYKARHPIFEAVRAQLALNNGMNNGLNASKDGNGPAVKVSGIYERRYGTKSLRVLWVVADVARDATRLERIKRWSEAEGGRSLFWFASLDELTPSGILGSSAWQVAGRDGQYALFE